MRPARFERSTMTYVASISNSLEKRMDRASFGSSHSLSGRQFATIALSSFLGMAIFLLASGLSGELGFPLDDSWIHATYARSLATTGEWVFRARGTIGRVHLTFLDASACAGILVWPGAALVEPLAGLRLSRDPGEHRRAGRPPPERAVQDSGALGRSFVEP